MNDDFYVKKEKIDAKKQFDKALISKTAIDYIYQDIIFDEDLINNIVDYPIVFDRMKNQDDASRLFLSEEESKLVFFLIAEVVFVLQMTSTIMEADRVDFSNLLSLSKTENILLLEIKSFLIRELLDQPLDHIVSVNFDFDFNKMPSNYLNIFYLYIKDYISI